jgi:GAF domain-containing protein
MEPLPQSREVLRRLAVYGDDLEAELEEVAGRLAVAVPGLVGFSLGVVEHGVTLTFVATGRVVAALDAVQYLDGGPCVEAAETGEPLQLGEQEVLDEARWQLFAQASAAAGVRSTLSLPILDGARVAAGVNLYGAGPDTFDGRVEQIAALFGAWAPGAVANADLSFTTRLEAARGPARLEELTVIDQAVGVLMARDGITQEVARARLEEAAARAGVRVIVLARSVVTRVRPEG